MPLSLTSNLAGRNLVAPTCPGGISPFIFNHSFGCRAFSYDRHSGGRESKHDNGFYAGSRTAASVCELRWLVAFSYIDGVRIVGEHRDTSLTPNIEKAEAEPRLFLARGDTGGHKQKEFYVAECIKTR